MQGCCGKENHPMEAAPDAEEIAHMCKALGHPARIQLLHYLAACGSCYFGNLAEVLPLAASTISQHVTILKQAGFILGSADEQRVFYCINPARMQQLQRLLSQL